MNLETYTPKDNSHESVEAFRLTEAFINTLPHHTGELLQRGEGMALLYTGRKVNGKTETVQGAVGDYVVYFKDGHKTIVEKRVFDMLYIKSKEVEEKAIDLTNKKEEENGTISTSAGTANGSGSDSDEKLSAEGGASGADGSDSEKAVSGSAVEPDRVAPSVAGSSEPSEPGHEQKGLESPNSGASDRKATNRKG